MLKIRSDPATIEMVKRHIMQQQPTLVFGGNVKLGILEVALDRDTAEFIFRVVDEIQKRRQRKIHLDVDQQKAAESGITRQFLNGYFRRS